MKIYKAAIIGLGPSGLAVNKLIYNNKESEIIAFESKNTENRDNFFGFWLTDWMKPFDKLVEKKWNSWEISNSDNNIIHTDLKSPYCVISFKTWQKYCLNTVNKLEIKKKKILSYYPFDRIYKLITEDNQEYFAEKIYDSRHEKEKNNELTQHFYGISIVTNKDKFDDTKLTLMHFTKDDNFLHFIYVLPFSKKKALIESTVISKKILNKQWYENKIYEYLSKNNIIEFEKISSETGIIPMFFSEQKIPNYPNVFNIGIRGGACKPSTGYAFSFLIKQIQLIKKSERNNVNVHKFLEKKMDKIFLNYLKYNNENGSSFIKLANNLNGTEFKDFMMGQSNLFTKIKIVNSMPKLPFIKSIFK